jgi:hypothetical protein
MTVSHRSPEKASSGRKFAAFIIAAFASVFVLGGVAGTYAVHYLAPPRPVVRTRVVHRTKVLEVPDPLTGCEQQLETALAGVYPWMKANHYALPVAANGWHPAESDCNKTGK